VVVAFPSLHWGQSANRYYLLQLVPSEEGGVTGKPAVSEGLAAWRSWTRGRLAGLAQIRRTGDNGDADRWLRMIVAIGELGEPPTDARH
jgi:hypothetical protein